MAGDERLIEAAVERPVDRLHYRLLGPVEVVRDGVPIDLGVLKQRALLAMLLIHANRVVSTDRSSTISGRETPARTGRTRCGSTSPGCGRRSSRTARSVATAPCSSPGRPATSCNVEPDDIDAVRFETLAREGRSLLETDPASASLVLSEALALWRGHALEEFTYESFADGRDRPIGRAPPGGGRRSDRRRSAHRAVPGAGR